MLLATRGTHVSLDRDCFTCGAGDENIEPQPERTNAELSGLPCGEAPHSHSLDHEPFLFAVVSTSNGSRAVWVVGGVSALLPTIVVSTTQLTALIPSALLSHAANAQVMVQTGDPAVATFNAVSFTVESPPPKGGGN